MAVVAAASVIMLAPAAARASDGHGSGTMAQSCRVGATSTGCTTPAAAASGGSIDIVILKPIAAAPCTYYVTDAANGKRVREGTFWYGNAFYDELTNVYSSYRLTLWNCTSFSEGYIG